MSRLQSQAAMWRAMPLFPQQCDMSSSFEFPVISLPLASHPFLAAGAARTATCRASFLRTARAS